MTRASVVRGLALVAAAAFAAAPWIIWLWVLLPGDEVTWGMAVLAFVYLAGAALLTVGAIRWYGGSARLLRVSGFALLLAGALANISFAFMLVPVALVAAPSLANRVSPESGDTTPTRTRNASVLPPMADPD